MKILDLLRKLGIFRSGSVSGTYQSGKDRPIEFMAEDVMDSKKDLINKEDLKKTKNFLKKKIGMTADNFSDLFPKKAQQKLVIAHLMKVNTSRQCVLWIWMTKELWKSGAVLVPAERGNKN